MANKLRRFKPNSKLNIKALLLWVGVFGLIGTSALLITRAATPGIAVIVDNSLPNPTNVKAYGDDQIASIDWTPPTDAAAKNIVGYYVTWGNQTGGVYTNAKQTTYSDTQIQPLVNGTVYNVKVQSVQGTITSVPVTGSYEPGNADQALANGKVSTGTVVTVTPTTARVDGLRTQLTGFFDDFNSPAGAFNELKWNTAESNCVGLGNGGTFINNQFHAHTQVRSGDCDRAQIINRPRAIFDITGRTESNPGVIAFDFDGVTHGRDAWYIDLIPTNARKSEAPLDITSHASVFDDSQGDPSMIRLEQQADKITVMYYGTDKNPHVITPTFSCPGWGSPNSIMGGCSKSTEAIVAGLSPIPEPVTTSGCPDWAPKCINPIPNYRRHWILQVSGTKVKVFVDGILFWEGPMPAEFANTNKFIIHNNLFSYNSGKGDATLPATSILHWDNFGFNGPASSTVVHNYLEGGTNGTQPYLGRGTTTNQITSAPRSVKVNIPDPVGSPTKARVMFTINNIGPDNYYWNAADNITINGHKYNYADPAVSSEQPPAIQTYYGTQIAEAYVPFADSISINASDLKQGLNDVALNIGANVRYMNLLNVHIELEYPKGTEPSYTPPATLFGASTYLAMFQPVNSAHDSYLFIEQDMGLPSGVIDSTTPVNPPPTTGDTTKPTVNLTAPATNTSVATGTSFTASASASDNVGVSKVEFYIGSTLKATDTSSPYDQSISTTGLGAGSYAISAVAYDAAGNSQTSSSINVTITAPPIISNKFQTLPVGAVLPSDSDCSSKVKPTAEVRATINASYNATKGIGGNYYYPKVTGNYTGTTDEIIQWAACKWGMDEDLLRAQAVQESYWFQNAIGDFTTTATSCTPIYPLANYPNQTNGMCPESIGIMQVRWNYHQSAYFQDSALKILTNNAVYSTAYNLDYYGAFWRSCYNGDFTWLNTVERGSDYSAGDAQGCQGVWYAGRWHTAGADQYIAAVQSNLQASVWETASFKNVTTANPIKSPTTPPTPTDTTAPVVTLTAPTAGATINGTIAVSANATDASGISSVSFYLDSSATPFSTDTSAPYSGNWNSALATNGSHTITAKATDTAGNTGSTTAVAVTVSNIVADTTAPTTAITTPANGSTLSATGTVTATATDAVGVARVELLIDGVVRATDTTSPYSYSWDTLTATNGTHTLQTKAYDAAGNTGASTALSVTVSNIVATPAAKIGDANGDGKVNTQDLSIVLKYWGTRQNARQFGDLNGDGIVNILDVSIVLREWGK